MTSFLENASHAFIDAMHRPFGWEIHPGYCAVQLQPLLSSGGLVKQNIIIINQYSDILEQEGTTYHESAHFLHQYAKTLSGDKRTDRQIELCELVADLGALLYIDTTGNTVVREKYLEYVTNSQLLLALLKSPKSLIELVHATPRTMKKIMERNINASEMK